MGRKVQPIWIFGDILRIDSEKREVQAFCFVNEKVRGQKMVLLRSAMEAATPDYMEWANVREMHRKDSAVGTVTSLSWEEKGCRVILRVVDDAAWDKVVAQVYKALSVGVLPTIVRGEEAHSVLWFEISLVDRPADPDAKILAFRAEDFEDGAEHEAEELPVGCDFLLRLDGDLPDVERERIQGVLQDVLAAAVTRSALPALELSEVVIDRAAFNDAMMDNEHERMRSNGIYQGMDNLHQAMHKISRTVADPDMRGEQTRAAMGEATDHFVKVMGAKAKTRSEDPEGDPPVVRAEPPDLTAIIERVEGQSAEIARLTGLVADLEDGTVIKRMRSEIKEMRDQPVRYHPVKFPEVHPLGRTIGGGEARTDPSPAQEIVQRMQAIQDEGRKPDLTDAKREDLANEFGRLKLELAGVSAAGAALSVLR